MSFWEENHKDKVVVIGDEPLDILINAFEKVNKIYLEDLERNPTVSEIEALIKLSLEGQEDIIFQLENNQVQDCVIKLKKYKTIRYGPGDIFVIPLKGHNHFSYGRILKGSNADKSHLFVEYYNLFTKKPISISQFLNREKEVLFIADTGVYGIYNKIWIKIRKMHYDESNFVMPDFFGEIDGKYYISKGANDDPESRVPASKEEAEKVKNPDGLIGSGIIGEMLLEEFKKTFK